MASPERGVEIKQKTPESTSERPETRSELSSAERGELLHEQTERADAARHEALGHAVSGPEQDAAEQERPASEKTATGPLNKKKQEASFAATMKQVQKEMSTPQRVFSKIIHSPAVERISDVTGTTIARPNAMLSGSIFAFTLVLGIYLLSRQLGFSLSGFETIGAFIVGWIFGVIFDFLRIMITGKH